MLNLLDLAFVMTYAYGFWGHSANITETNLFNSKHVWTNIRFLYVSYLLWHYHTALKTGQVHMWPLIEHVFIFYPSYLETDRLSTILSNYVYWAFFLMWIQDFVTSQFFNFLSGLEHGFACAFWRVKVLYIVCNKPSTRQSLRDETE